MRNLVLLMTLAALGCAGSKALVKPVESPRLGAEVLMAMEEAQAKLAGQTQAAEGQFRSLSGQVGDLRRATEAVLDQKAPMAVFAPEAVEQAVKAASAAPGPSRLDKTIELLSKVDHLAGQVGAAVAAVQQTRDQVVTLADQVEKFRAVPLPPTPPVPGVLETGGPGALLALLAYLLGWLNRRRAKPTTSAP